jgi:hypothetical protein
VQVVLDTQDNGSTDGQRIFFRPPISLGDNTPHQRRLCDKRDEQLQLQCPACLVMEDVLTTIYHEIAHICFDTFASTKEEDRMKAIEAAIAESGTKYADKIRKAINGAPPYRKNSYLGLAGMVSPFLPVIVNALEDVRVNRELFNARKGTRVMFEANEWRTFENGVEQVDPMTGQTVKKEWKTYPLNMQAIIGVYCKATGYKYDNWFVPEIIEALADSELTNLLNRMHTIRSAKGVYELAFPVLTRLRELGYCKSDTDPEDEPEEQDSDDTSGTDDDDVSDEGSEADADESGSSSSPGDSGEGRDRGESSSGSGSGDSEGEVGSGSEPDDSEESSSSSGSSGSGGEASGDAEADAEQDEPGDDAGSSASSSDPGDESAGDEADGGSSSSVAGDEADADDSADAGRSGDDSAGSRSVDEPGAAGREDEEVDDPADDAESGEGGADSSAPGQHEGDGAGDSADGSDADDADVRETRDGDDPQSDEGGEPAGDAADSADAESGDRDSASSVDDDLIDSGADEGEGGVKLEYGSADEVQAGLEKWGGHEDKKPTRAEMADGEAVTKAILGMYFETPSASVIGVREHHYGQPMILNGHNYSQAWESRRGGIYGSMGYSDKALGKEGDFSCAESILGPALLRMRVAFADNKRGKTIEHIKSGKVNGRVLGKRAPSGDDRLFKRKILPGKKDYFVLLGLDVSGSTVGRNIALIKASAMAQATLLQRMGVNFAIYAHTGNQHAGHGVYGLDLDIYVIKSADDPWDSKVQERLTQLGPDSCNLDGHTLEYYRKRLDERPETDKIIMYYTDGKMPAENHDEELEILQRELKICKRKQYIVMGVGIRTDSPVRHGLDTVQIDTIEEVGKVVKHLEKVLK